MEAELRTIASDIAQAISRRDTTRLRRHLAPGFIHRSHGGEASTAETFLLAISEIPGEIVFVRLENLRVDLCPSGALVTGTQHAQVLVDGEAVDDRRGFVDWFIRHEGEWLLQAAVDLPVAPGE